MTRSFSSRLCRRFHYQRYTSAYITCCPPRRLCRAISHTLTFLPARSQYSFRSFFHPHCHSKPIARPFQNGFLQVAVSKTLRPPAFPTPEPSICRSVSDTALRLHGSNVSERVCGPDASITLHYAVKRIPRETPSTNVIEKRIGLR